MGVAQTPRVISLSNKHLLAPKPYCEYCEHCSGVFDRRQLHQHLISVVCIG